jgi:hypothetical protein
MPALLLPRPPSTSSPPRPAARTFVTRRRRLLLAPLAIVLAAHGLVHLMGVSLLWRLGEPGELSYADAVPDPGTALGYLVGAVWLLAAAVLVAAAVLLLGSRSAWRRTALSGAVLSSAVIALNPEPAVAGLVVNGLVLLAVLGSSLLQLRRARAAVP